MNRTRHKGLKVLTALSLALSITSCAGNGAGGLGQSESYKVGYDLGLSGSIGQMIFYGQAGGPSAACDLIFEMSVQGTTNDGIDWASLDQSEYLDGCMDGQLEAHPDADWNN